MTENDVYLNKDEKTMTEINQYLTFKLVNENYGLMLEKAKEIIKPPKITNVPNTEEHVMGVINIRGKVTPVIDLKNKLGLVSIKNKKQENRVIITNIEGVMVGLFVDSVSEVVKIKQKEVEQASAEVDRGLSDEFIKGVVPSNNNLIIILNIEEILFGKEQTEKVINNA